MDPNIIAETKAMDIIIAGIGYSAITAIICGTILLFSKRRPLILSLLLIIMGIGVAGVIGYGTYQGMSETEVRKETIDLEDYTGEPFSMVILSDLHIGKYNNSSRLEKAVDAIKDIEANYVFILGDLVNSTDEDFDELGVLEEITGDKWVYAIYGNHDYHIPDSEEESIKLVDGLPERLSEIGVTVLDNSAIWTGESPEDTIIFGGIRDMWARDYNTGFTDYINPEDTFVLLSHNPDAVLLASEGLQEDGLVDLILSGHTHGGESRMPVVGPLSPIPTLLPRTFDQGLKVYDDIPVYITSGIGSIGTMLRLENPPEIVVLTIE